MGMIVMDGSIKSHTISVILFDADGVLFDISGIHESVVREMLEKLKLENKYDASEVHREWDLEDEKLQRKHSTPQTFLSPIKTLTHSLTIILDRLSISITESQKSEYAKQNIDRLCTQARLFPEANEILSLLNAEYELGIISNMAVAATNRKINVTGIKNVFRHIIGPETFQAYKPSSSIFHQTLELFGISPTAAIFIGDSPNTDIIGGKIAGIPTVLIDRHCKHKNLNPPPNYRIKSLSELQDILVSL